jgi:hypothetical protein
MEDFASPSEMAASLRERLTENIFTGKSGRTIALFLWANSFTMIRSRVMTLLPTSSIPPEDRGLSGGKVKRPGVFKPPILESTPEQIMKSLSDLWIFSNLISILNEVRLAEFAVQAAQLESASESLTTEHRLIKMGLRKAIRSELNKAMREVFSQTSEVKNKAKAA